MGFEIIQPGLLSTLQDEGRYGYRKYGVISSGPMDHFAHRSANILVGNSAGACALEMTLLGPSMLAKEDMIAALCGAETDAELDGIRVPMWRPFVIPKGSKLNVHYAVKGCRAYLAVSGGFKALPIMGSQSTYLRAGLGGYKGRALQAGDRLGVCEPQRLSTSEGFKRFQGEVSTYIRPHYEDNPILRVVWGNEAAHFTAESRSRFAEQSFRVTPQSDRMGYRLAGSQLNPVDGLAQGMVSEAVTPGTIQVPSSGQLILLMADCQTTGGYPRIAHVITADLPLAAQVKPGGTLRFRAISHQEAQEQLLRQAMNLRLLEVGVQARVRNQHG
ncbi:hypothetical protein BC351_34040 [Paenibacillus ferrarius]|uniref:Carboxyltransferase domain-containing protein n=1 Tax=Paenibacillus ferrarius TaxID=1469647 RepID=A0A1V4HE64_9BACL|nr:biotin-dependent carboxyltransferase family protein [Paenibacillus ferrarius]OPH52000.1 hypothetical protein BC351_34040 [Paenibacillus ferrarius]